jgi:cytochrome c oxidase assembly protein subunit 15
MAQNSADSHTAIAPWHQKLLVTTAVFTVLLIAMGGILCMTQSIRDCPDWPGCFGKIIPPAETGPILEYTHRVLAALSGLLILTSAVVGLIRVRRSLWISLPPLVSIVLLVEVSYFGAQVVLRGLSPGWAAVDVGSALLVVALMVATSTAALANKDPSLRIDRLKYQSPFSRIVLAATLVVYMILVSGILVAGKNSVTGCLGWPIYSQQLAQMDAHKLGEVIRQVVSLIGIGLILFVLIFAWRNRQSHPAIFPLVNWVGLAFLSEMLLQILILIFGHLVGLLVAYTVIMAALWGLLVAFTVRLGLEEAQA